MFTWPGLFTFSPCNCYKKKMHRLSCWMMRDAWDGLGCLSHHSWGCYQPTTSQFPTMGLSPAKISRAPKPMWKLTTDLRARPPEISPAQPSPDRLHPLRLVSEINVYCFMSPRLRGICYAALSCQQITDTGHIFFIGLFWKIIKMIVSPEHRVGIWPVEVVRDAELLLPWDTCERY